MAEKILNTRIILRNDDLGTWNDNPNRELKAGEVALVRVNTTMPNGQGGSYSVPTYLMKVGAYKEAPTTQNPQGTLYKFSELNWLAAPASDVHAWAKAETKPTYTGAEIKVSDATGAQTVSAAIAALEGAVGTDGSVAQQIAAAIEALDVDDYKEEATDSAEAGGRAQFVTAIQQADGKISATRRSLTADDIPALGIDKITGLQNALDAKAPLADFNIIKDTVSDANNGLVKKLNDEVNARVQGDEALGKRIDDLKKDIGNVTNIMNFRGVVSTTYKEMNDEIGAEEEKTYTSVSAAVAADTKFQGNGNDPVSGDVIIYGNKEHVYNGENWVEFGDATVNEALISALDRRVEENEKDIAALEEASSAHATTAYVDEELAKKLDVSTFNNHVTNVINPLVSTVGDDKAGLVKDVADLQKTVGDDNDGLVKDVAELKTASATHATTTALAAQKDRIDAIEDRFGVASDVLIFDCGTATANW